MKENTRERKEVRNFYKYLKEENKHDTTPHIKEKEENLIGNKDE